MRYGIFLLSLLWVSAVTSQELVWKNQKPEVWAEVLSNAITAKPEQRPLIRQQWYAAYALGQYGKDAVGTVDVLLKRLSVDQGQDDYVRAAIALTLGQIGDKKAVSALMDELAGNPDYPAVRRNAAKALGMFGNWAKEERPDVVERLLSSMQDDKDVGVRTNAAVALWNVNRSPAVMDFVRKHLASSETLDVYQGAIVAAELADVWDDSAAIAQMLIPPIASRRLQEQDTARICTQALGMLGPDAVPAVREAFEKASDATSRSRYLTAIAAMDRTLPTMDLLLKITADKAEKEPVRIAAVRGLRKVLPEKRDDAKRVTIQVVNDPETSSALVYEAAQTLKFIE